jgi:phospholipase C
MKPFLKRPAFALAMALSSLPMAIAAAKTTALEGVPRFDHVFVIIEENKDYDQILGGVSAPNIAGYAKDYGSATRFFGEVHPSEGNYVALLGGDTYGIHDDDGVFCKPGSTASECPQAASQPGYPDHTVHAAGLGDQLAGAGLTWKGYYESLPEPGSLVYTASDPKFDHGTGRAALYASKHSGFLNFASVQSDPDRARKIVGFDQLDADLARDDLPNFALVVPNQCNEMHGLYGPGLPADCLSSNVAALVRRGDAETARLVERIEATKAWSSKGNFAIVITFDEGAAGERSGCCGVTPQARSNFGGGHIPTIVITNHGPRGLSDSTPYNHYSLLRTVEDAFGIDQHLGHASESGNGVRPMARLFGGS